MAVVRTVLSRKGIIMPKHGASYEADLDRNWQTVDSKLQDAADVQTAIVAAGTVQAWLQDRGISGVISGFALSTSANLVPRVSTGVLYAQGKRYSPAEPSPGAAPADTTSHLWYNTTSGFYYNLSGSPGTTGDAYLGSVVTDSTRVTSAMAATKPYTYLSVTAPTAGNFSVLHSLGRIPTGVQLYLTSNGVVWFQSPLMFDAYNLYLAASAAGLTAYVQIW